MVWKDCKIVTKKSIAFSTDCGIKRVFFEEGDTLPFILLCIYLFLELARNKPKLLSNLFYSMHKKVHSKIINLKMRTASPKAALHRKIMESNSQNSIQTTKLIQCEINSKPSLITQLSDFYLLCNGWGSIPLY